MKISNLKWILIFVAIVLICLIFAIFSNNAPANKAEIYVDDKLVRTVENLYPDKENDFTVETEWGENEIAVYDGAIWVKSSDCKNQTCVHFGKLSSTGSTIICAPHKLVIKLVGENDADVTV